MMRHSSNTAILPNIIEANDKKDLDADQDTEKEEVVYPSAAIPALSDVEQYTVSVSDELHEPSTKWPFAQRLLSWGVELRGQRHFFLPSVG